MTMFNPTHLLISRSRHIPVQLIQGAKGYFLQTKQDWQANREPAFAMSSSLGVYCRGIAVVGYHLEPIANQASKTTTKVSTAQV